MSGRVAAVLVATVLAVAVPAVAGWIVLRDGSRIETSGPWRLEDGQVVFTLPNGTLASIRREEVDLKATRGGRTSVEEPSSSPTPAASPSVDHVLSPASPRSPSPLPQLSPQRARPPAPTVTAPPPVLTGTPPGVRVRSWKETPTGRGTVRIQGVVANEGTELVTDLALGVLVLDATGNLMARVETALATSHLEAGASTTFQALLPVPSGTGRLRFRLFGQGIAFRPLEPGDGERSDGQPPHRR
jgi:hypothetical protein